MRPGHGQSLGQDRDAGWSKGSPSTALRRTVGGWNGMLRAVLNTRSVTRVEKNPCVITAISTLVR